MRVTFLNAQNSRLPAVIGACPTDDRFKSLLNEVLERLMYEGHWHNTTQRVRFCATDGCITQPPKVATIEKVAVCGQPITLRTQWTEFLENGSGIRSSLPNSGSAGCCGNSSWNGWCNGGEAIPKGYFPTFSDLVGTNKKVNLICDLASDVGKNVLVLGYDANGNWIRTLQDSVISDGELVPLAQSDGTTSVNFFTSITDIQFNDARSGQVWLYELNVDTNIKRMIGIYQYFETRPNYPRWLFPGIRSGTNGNGSCNQTLVDAIVKLNFWPVSAPNDYLCVPCLPALKEMLMAVNEAEHSPDGIQKVQIVTAGLASAKLILNSQLQHFTGDGVVPSIEVMGSSIYGNDPVCNLI